MRQGENGERYRRALDDATKSRLILFALLTSLAGLALLLAADADTGSWGERLRASAVLGSVPFAAIGSSLVSAGVVLIAFELYVRRQVDVLGEIRSEALLQAYEERISVRLLEVIDVGDEVALQQLTRSLNPSRLRALAVNAVSAVIENRGVSEAAIDQMLRRLQLSGEVWRNLEMRMSLQPTDSTQPSGPYMDLHIYTTFETSTLANIVTCCISDVSIYAKTLQEGRYHWLGYHEPTAEYPEPDASAFRLDRCNIDGVPIQVTERTEQGRVEFIAQVEDSLASLNKPASQQGSRVELWLRMRVQRRSHCLRVDVPRITQSARYDLDYSGCGIRFLNVLPSFASPAIPTIDRFGGRRQRVHVSIEDWVFPMAGVAFVWVLDEEMTPEFLALPERIARLREREQ